MVAAGVAFYGFLAIVPLLGSVVLLYGLIADSTTVLRDIHALVTTLPAYIAKLIAQQLVEIVTASADKKGSGLIAALGLAIFGARNGAASLISALNIAYEENETRSLAHRTLLALAITASAVLIAFIAVVAIAALGHLGKLLPAYSDTVIILGKFFAYILVASAGAAGAAALYRYGPDRAHSRWVWLTPGSLVASIGWLVLTLGFGIYIANVDDYSATYGSLSAIVVLLTWLYLSSYILLIGAELNSEFERQITDRTSEEQKSSILTKDILDGVDTKTENKLALQIIPLSDEIDPSAASEQEIYGAKPVMDGTTPRSVAADVATIRGISAASRLVRLGRVGAFPSIAAAGGLALLRRRGHARKGSALLFTAGMIAFFGRSGHSKG